MQLLCQLGFSRIDHNFQSPVRSDKITEEVKTKLSKRYNMQLIGITGGMTDCVNELGLSFQIRGPIAKDILRKMLVDCVQEFLAPINADEKLRPFLKNYPITPKEIMIEIYIVNDRGGNVYDPEISVAVAKRGRLRYHTEDENDRFSYKKVTEEDYEIARKIVQEEK